MPSTIDMPALSPTMEEGTIAEWIKKEGDLIKEGDVICTIQTDKATLEFEALDGGYLRKHLVEIGKMVKVNEPIAIISDKPDEPIDDVMPKKEDAPSAKKEEPSTEKEPQVQTQKTAARPAAAFAPEPPPQNYSFSARAPGEIKASPLAKKIAKEKGLDLSSVKGSGPGGRIVEKDLEFAQKATPVSFGSKGLPEEKAGEFEEVTLTPMRSVIGQRLLESKQNIPHYYLTEEIDCDRLVDVREELKNLGVKMTYNDFVLRATALSLREHPEMNTGFDSTRNAIIAFKTVDISLAVDIPDGLITPIIRHADYKNIQELSLEAKKLAKKAREGTLALEEFKGGSFTISNLGMFGIKAFSAVINPPQSGILAVGGIKQVPVVKKGKVALGHTMQVTLSADHRVVDGAMAARFLVTLKKFLEHPSVLIS